jgi:hypothetical protein
MITKSVKNKGQRLKDKSNLWWFNFESKPDINPIKEGVVCWTEIPVLHSTILSFLTKKSLFNYFFLIY